MDWTESNVWRWNWTFSLQRFLPAHTHIHIQCEQCEATQRAKSLNVVWFMFLATEYTELAYKQYTNGRASTAALRITRYTNIKQRAQTWETAQHWLYCEHQPAGRSILSFINTLSVSQFIKRNEFTYIYKMKALNTEGLLFVYITLVLYPFGLLCISFASFNSNFE